MDGNNMKITLTEMGHKRYRETVLLDGGMDPCPVFEQEEAFGRLTQRYGGKKLKADHRKIADALLPAYDAGVVLATKKKMEIRLAGHMIVGSVEEDGKQEIFRSNYSLVGIIALQDGRIREVSWVDDYSDFGPHNEMADEYGCTDDEWQGSVKTMETLLSRITEE